jgi:diadenosine tetraphosphatase ApaH/serine/threonine PP2A family protein phosphatase
VTRYSQPLALLGAGSPLPAKTYYNMPIPPQGYASRMKILIISDIHANLTALETVLDAAGEFDAAWCLGDVVGYGPDPNECIDLVRSLPGMQCIMGNHDAAVIRKIDDNAFNQDARLAVAWTASMLTEESLDFLTNLPERLVLNGVTLVHGSPRQPIWEYLLDTRTVTVSFGFFDTPFCFVGHTHLPVVYYMADDSRSARLTIPEDNTQIALAPRTIINPGSVGQPRDRDPRAAYAIYDPEQSLWEFRRVRYDIDEVQDRMRLANLPERHILRLGAGW